MGGTTGTETSEIEGENTVGGNTVENPVPVPVGTRRMVEVKQDNHVFTAIIPVRVLANRNHINVYTGDDEVKALFENAFDIEERKGEARAAEENGKRATKTVTYDPDSPIPTWTQFQGSRISEDVVEIFKKRFEYLVKVDPTLKHGDVFDQWSMFIAKVQEKLAYRRRQWSAKIKVDNPDLVEETKLGKGNQKIEVNYLLAALANNFSHPSSYGIEKKGVHEEYLKWKAAADKVAQLPTPSMPKLSSDDESSDEDTQGDPQEEEGRSKH